MGTTNQNMTIHGDPLEVTGTCLQVGGKMPTFTLSGADLKDISSTSFSGKVLVISVVPSLDTPTCDLQTKRFNKEASTLSDDVVVLTVSRDLPFAQKRWCGANDAASITVASDYKYRTFGQAFGVDVPGVGLLARAVFVVDTTGTIQYIDYVSELTAEPEYAPVLETVKGLV